MDVSGAQWPQLLEQVRAYLSILQEGGFVVAEGRFDLAPACAPPRAGAGGAGKAPAAARPAGAAYSPEERAALKAALTDPYAHLGVPLLSAAPATPRKPAAHAAAKSSAPGAPRGASAPAGGPPAPKGKTVTLRDRAEGVKLIAAAPDLDRIRHLVSGCYMCGLSAGRTLTVPGEGHPHAELMFVGEGPGYNEDLQGKPFVGRAGDLLTQMIEAMKLRREDVFITNIVKCRPPGNRDPLPDEIAACAPFLKRQLELIRPAVICALGRIAIQGLLRDTTPITQLRGKWRSYEDIPLMPTFHPAYLLRSPGEKRKAWEDLKAILARMAELKKGG